ncbi:SusC/RagA family TonB-linked outer membrane protein [Alistipes sp.]|uniref:SusC/RagA family TonB-linked outer membrane protein n=1 Tax=Alistipes sp. TaxID=1872444 RepID=UPI003AF1A145
MKKIYLAAGKGAHAVAACFRCLAVVPMLLLGCYGAHAAAQPHEAASRVTVDARNVAIVQVFQTIQQQTGYSFVYNTSDIDTQRNVSMVARNEPLTAVLDRLFAGTDIAYTLRDKHVVLSKKAKNSPPQTAQSGVEGTVKDEKGMPLIGATVLIQGTTTGAAVDLDGNFSLPQAKKGDVLEVSLIGYKKQLVPVTGAPLTVVLAEDNEVLDAVVVTALGIKRAEKSLTYNVQKVEGDLVTTVKDANFMNALSGKIAGMQINASASGAGGSTRVVLRGVKSINGDNNALYVIDGIPMPSLRSAQTAGIYETPDGGDFEGIANINPEDIESMSILSGATAAALYGSQGANGVVLITTKKGSAGGVRVNYSNSTTFSSPFVMPRFQNTYGTDVNSPSMSWGEKLAKPSSYDPADFFQTGFNETNSIGLTAGTDRNQMYASASAVNTRGIIPNNVYNRYNFSLRNSSVLIPEKLTLDLGASYMKQYTRNALVQGLYHNPLIGIYLFPVGDDIRKYQVYERYDNAAGYNKQFWPLEYMNGVENPYWVTNRQLFENTMQRYTFNATMKWDVTSWLSLTGRVRSDNMTMNYTRKIWASSNTLFASEYGNYLNHKVNHNNLYADALLSIDKTFFDDQFSLQFNFGASLMDDKNSRTGYEGNLAGIENKFTFNNIVTSDPNTLPMQENYHDQTQAIYATLQLGYKGMLYVDASLRNEWASQLAFTPRMNIFYPSVGVSAVISSMADLSKAGISFLKVRGSYAEVGNAPQRYITGNNYGLLNGSVTAQTIAPARHLRPERTKSFEAGLNAKFLGNKIWLDATYYNTNTFNQLFLYDAPPSSGYKQKYLNSGKVNNYGIEAVIGYKNTWRDFSWSTNFNFSLNRNEIKQLVPKGTLDPDTGEPVDLPYVNFDYGGYRIHLEKGGSIGDFYVTGLKTDDKGNIYVDPNSGAVSTDNNTWIYGGNTEARYRMSWNNTFSYKGVSLGVLIDARIGGRGVSVTQALMDRYGVSEASAIARDMKGVQLNATQTITGVQDFYNNVGDGMGMMSQYIYNMSNVRLRELTVGYDLPAKWFNNKLLATVSFVGRNLFMFYNKAPFDPESTASTSTYYQNFDYFMQPSVRTLGFSVRLQF